MENLKTTLADTRIVEAQYLTAERAIHASIFFLLLVGLAALTAWASYNFLQSNLILVFGIITLSWGIILLALYLSFKKLYWNWWS